MKSNALTLRQILNQLQASVNDDLTEEQLLDLPIKVHIPHSSAQYSTVTPVMNCSVKNRKEYCKAEQRVTVVETWIDMDTNPIT
jgi:hypothetical protein